MIQSSRVRLWLLLAAAMLFVGVGVSTIYRAGLGPHERSDFTVYWHAGQAVLEGSDIYQAQNPRGWFYMYLPIFAAVVSPLSLLPKPVAAGVWYLINLAALLHLAWVSVRLASRTTSNDTRLALGIAVLALSAWPWLSALGRGQVSILLAWCVTIVIDLWIRRPKGLFPVAAGGLALAVSVVLKVFPILMLGWLLVTRRWRAIVATGVALCVLVLPAPALVFGWDGNLKLLGHWGRTILLPLGDATEEQNVRYKQMMNPRIDKNQSVQAVAVRIIAPAEEAGDVDRRERMARLLAAGINGGLLLVSAGVIWRAVRWQSDGEAGLDVQTQVLSASVVLLLCLFIAPVSWTHNYTLAILPLSVAIARGWIDRDSRLSVHYRRVVAIWCVGMVGSLAHPIYHVGGHLLAALGIWIVMVLELASMGQVQLQHAANSSTAAEAERTNA